jgi:hypothetical protein
LGGTWLGLATVDLGPGISPVLYVPAAVNLFALTWFTAGAATLVSSWERYRSRAIGAITAFYVVQLIVKLIARMVPDWEWLMRYTFVGAYQPQMMVTQADEAWALSLRYDGVLLVMGAAAFALAAAIFCRRDLPAPL